MSQDNGTNAPSVPPSGNGGSSDGKLRNGQLRAAIETGAAHEREAMSAGAEQALTPDEARRRGLQTGRRLASAATAQLVAERVGWDPRTLREMTRANPVAALTTLVGE